MASQPEVTVPSLLPWGKSPAPLELFLHEYVGVSQVSTVTQAYMQEVEAGEGVQGHPLIYNPFVSH